MRLWIAPAIIVLPLAGLAGTAAAQSAMPSIVEVARQQRALREASGVSVRGVLTNEDIAQSDSPVVVLGRVSELPSEENSGVPMPEAGDATLEDSENESADPGAAIAEQQRIVQQLEDREVQLQLEVSRHRGEFVAPVVSQRESAEALEAMSASEARLEALRVELTEARETLRTLEEAAAQTAPNP